MKKKIVETPYGKLYLEEPSEECIDWAVKAILNKILSVEEEDNSGELSK